MRNIIKREKQLKRRPVFEEGKKVLVEVLHVPLLSCSVPQLHVDLLRST